MSPAIQILRGKLNELLASASDGVLAETYRASIREGLLRVSEGKARGALEETRDLLAMSSDEEIAVDFRQMINRFMDTFSYNEKHIAQWVSDVAKGIMETQRIMQRVS